MPCNVPRLTQASFLQKKSNVAKWFFDIGNGEMAQSLSSLQKSDFLKLIISIFHVKILNNLCELDVTSCLQLLSFWNFFVFFWFFPLKLVYFWTKSRKNIYECFFHSICATDPKFGTKNNVRTIQSTLKTLIFVNYWGS